MKSFQISVGGVELFAGSFAAAVEVIESTVEKPRFPVAKSAIAAADVGSKFVVTSRIKGSNSKVTVFVVEVADEAPKAKKVPAGAPTLRKASWDWLTEQLSGVEITEVEVRKITDKRFNLHVNGKKVWYSPYESVALAAKAEVEAKLMKAA